MIKNPISLNVSNSKTKCPCSWTLFWLDQGFESGLSEKPGAFGILRKTSSGNKEKELREAAQKMSGGEGPW